MEDKYIKSFGIQIIRCEHRDVCTSSDYHCKTCLRNKANDYSDKFSLSKGGYKSNWMKDIDRRRNNMFIVIYTKNKTTETVCEGSYVDCLDFYTKNKSKYRQEGKNLELISLL